MRAKDIPGLSGLSTAEKILLAEDLWESIVDEAGDLPLPESHARELDARIARHSSNPGALLSIEALQDRINRRK